MEYKEVTSKVTEALAALTTALKIHEAFLQAHAMAGTLSKEDAKQDHDHMVVKIIEYIKKEHDTK